MKTILSKKDILISDTVQLQSVLMESAKLTNVQMESVKSQASISMKELKEVLEDNFNIFDFIALRRLDIF